MSFVAVRKRTSASRTTRPVSSATSRTAQASGDSPTSRCPPGSCIAPAERSMSECADALVHVVSLRRKRERTCAVAPLAHTGDELEPRVEQEAADSYAHLSSHGRGRVWERAEREGDRLAPRRSHMRRLVLFEGAPSAAQCYSSLDLDLQPAASWHTLAIDLTLPASPHQPTPSSPPPRPPASAAPPPTARQPTIKPEPSSPAVGGNPWDVTASQFHHAVEGSPVQDERATAAREEEPDSLELSRRRTRRRSSSSPELERSEQEDEGEGVSRTSASAPPASTLRRPLTPSLTQAS